MNFGLGNYFSSRMAYKLLRADPNDLEQIVWNSARRLRLVQRSSTLCVVFFTVAFPYKITNSTSICSMHMPQGNQVTQKSRDLRSNSNGSLSDSYRWSRWENIARWKGLDASLFVNQQLEEFAWRLIVTELVVPVERSSIQFIITNTKYPDQYQVSFLILSEAFNRTWMNIWHLNQALDVLVWTENFRGHING